MIIFLTLYLGVFPYEYVTGRNVLKEKSLPPIECFNSSLGVGRVVSQDDYNHALKVWDVFGCKTFKDYMEIYVELGKIYL